MIYKEKKLLLIEDAAEEYFEFDAEEFLVFLTLLITEGRTPEFSVKGRTEGLHCPPAQSGQPVNNKHECSDKLPQCRQARRTRSEVVLLWRNNIPIMVEVMVLPDCCYSDEYPSTDGNDLHDPAIKQDALLLERWTLQPVPRQSGDRFIEEKTLLLAVRSFVFFSQLSAWLSASHGVVPRNILYRVSAADEELLWNFSQHPNEHVFPVPNVSHSVALKVSVQSLPRQPNYPVLKCSIHTSITHFGKKTEEYEGITTGHTSITDENQINSPGSAQRFTKQSWAQFPQSIANPRKCLPAEVLSPSIKWFHPKLCNSSESFNSSSVKDCSVVQNIETQTRSFKSLSLNDSCTSVSPCSRLPSVEPSPLIGSLLQERQEVIARIAQHLDYCDPTSPHVSGNLFCSHDQNSLVSKTPWGSLEDDVLLKKCKESSLSSYVTQHSVCQEHGSEGKSRSSSPETPITSCSTNKRDRQTQCSPLARRRLLLSSSPENCRILPTAQEVSRLTHTSFPQPHNKCGSLLNCTYEKCKNGKLKVTYQNGTVCSNGQCKDQIPCLDNCPVLVKETSTDSQICTDFKSSIRNLPDKVDCFSNLHKESCTKLEDATHKHVSQSSDSFCNAKKQPENIMSKDCIRRTDLSEQSKLELSETSLHEKIKHSKDPIPFSQKPLPDENKDPPESSTFPGTLFRGAFKDRKEKDERMRNVNVLTINGESSLKPCNLWKSQKCRSLDGTAAKAFHPCTGLPLLSSPVPQRRTRSGCFDLDTTLSSYKNLPWSATKRVFLKLHSQEKQSQQLLSTSAPPATSLSLLGNFEESVLNFRLEPLGVVDGFTAEVGASGIFCPSHMTLPVEVSFYSVSDDNAPSPYMGIINLDPLGKKGYRVPPSGTIQVTLFNPNKTVVKMFVVIYNLREMPANHQTFLRQRTFSVPVKHVSRNGNKKTLLQTEERILRYLVHLRFQSTKSGKIYLHTDIRLLFSRKSMEVDSGAAYELKSYTEAPANPPFSPRC
ncbi:protein FAM214A isoform X1 [Polypterus senegalus]|uniref:protein FAM214A isoform X1 n=1 Tax=Polypterus senegalus TaxID=55291 RepID=UPI001963EB9C|nr:protein FAM214A isoform X1 [Polypterus senegalus]